MTEKPDWSGFTPVVDPIFPAIDAFQATARAWVKAHDAVKDLRGSLPAGIVRELPSVCVGFKTTAAGTEYILATTHDEIDRMWDASRANYRGLSEQAERHFAPAIEMWRKTCHDALDIDQRQLTETQEQHGLTRAETAEIDAKLAMRAAADRVASTVPVTQSGINALAEWIRDFALNRDIHMVDGLDQEWAITTLTTAVRRYAENVFVDNAGVVPEGARGMLELPLQREPHETRQ